MRLLLVLLVVRGLASAQEATSATPPQIPAPPAVRLTLELREARSQYRMGELVPLRLDYSSEGQGKYVKAAVASDLRNGEAESLSCEPANLTAPVRPGPSVNLRSFLYADKSCLHGFGGGGSGFCGDCHGFYALGPVPLSYELDLNREVQLLRPGHYVCKATSADVAFASLPAEQRTAVRLVSNPVGLEVIDEPTWSPAALAEAQAQIQASCDDNASPPPEEGERWLHCVHAAEVLRFLNTEDSLRAAVRLLKGNGKAYWQTELWDSISQSSNRKLAIALLSQRMRESDFAVTENFVDTLGAWRLPRRHPEAFASDGHAINPEDYNHEAVDLLRDSVRSLGDSLAVKRGTAAADSAKTYETLSAWHDCRNRPLIPRSEARASLATAGQ
jgi:hypothetical protein